MRVIALSALSSVLAAAASSAQVRVDSHGVRSGGTVIDGSGIHIGATRVDGDGVHRDGGGSTTTIMTDGNRRAVDCGGAGLTVDGNHNRLTVANCRTIVVDGNDNMVALSFTAPGRVSVPGNHNQVSWSAPRGITVGVSSPGAGNHVARR